MRLKISGWLPPLLLLPLLAGCPWGAAPANGPAPTPTPDSGGGTVDPESTGSSGMELLEGDQEVATELVLSAVWNDLPAAAAVVYGDPIYREEFIQAFLASDAHRVILYRFILDHLVRFECAVRQITAGAEEVRTRLGRIRQEMQEYYRSREVTLEELVAGLGLTMDAYRVEVERLIMLEKLARIQLNLAAGEAVTPVQREQVVRRLWQTYEASIILHRPLLAARNAPPGTVMILDNLEISRDQYARYILNSIQREQAEEILQQLILKKMIDRRLEKAGRPVTDQQLARVWSDLLLGRGEEHGLGPETYLPLRNNPPEGRETLRYILGLNRLINPPSEAELVEYFQANLVVYQRVRREARHILVSAFDREGRPRWGLTREESFTEARRRASGYLAEIRANPALFATYAADPEINADEPRREKGGNLGYFLLREPKYQGFGPLLEAAFAATAGDDGQYPPELVETGFGCHVLQVLDQTPPREVEFAEARQRVYQDWMIQARRDKVQELLQEARQPRVVTRPLIEALVLRRQ